MKDFKLNPIKAMKEDRISILADTVMVITLLAISLFISIVSFIIASPVKLISKVFSK